VELLGRLRDRAHEMLADGQRAGGDPMTRSVPILSAAALALALAAPVAAQEEVAKTTISAIERGEAEAVVYLEGAVLYQEVGDDEYLFSDGTGAIMIDADDAASEGELPLFELIGIEGTVASGEIDVARWVPLRIVTPAVIVPEEQVIAAYQGWIVAYGSQAPEPTE
jgi:uncharacterized protein YdeI (BOF family)